MRFRSGRLQIDETPAFWIFDPTSVGFRFAWIGITGQFVT